jgi:hypothetical protein
VRKPQPSYHPRDAAADSGGPRPPPAEAPGSPQPPMEPVVSAVATLTSLALMASGLPDALAAWRYVAAGARDKLAAVPSSPGLSPSRRRRAAPAAPAAAAADAGPPPHPPTPPPARKPILPLAVMAVDNAIGLWYAVLVRDALGASLRALGVGLAAAYAAGAVLAAPPGPLARDADVAVLKTAAVVAAAIAGGVVALVPAPLRSAALGAVTTATALSFAASPLAAAASAIGRGDASGISPVMSGALAACAGAWAVRGVLLGLPAVVVPNAINFALAVVQLGAWAALRPRRGGTGSGTGAAVTVPTRRARSPRAVPAPPAPPAPARGRQGVGEAPSAAAASAATVVAASTAQRAPRHERPAEASGRTRVGSPSYQQH